MHTFNICNIDYFNTAHLCLIPPANSPTDLATTRDLPSDSNL